MTNGNVINISLTTARWLLRLSTRLVSVGLGSEWRPGDNPYEIEGPGMLDELPLENSDLWIWANALVNLARTVAGILNDGLNDNEITAAAAILSSLSDSDDRISSPTGVDEL